MIRTGGALRQSKLAITTLNCRWSSNLERAVGLEEIGDRAVSEQVRPHYVKLFTILV